MASLITLVPEAIQTIILDQKVFTPRHQHPANEISYTAKEASQQLGLKVVCSAAVFAGSKNLVVDMHGVTGAKSPVFQGSDYRFYILVPDQHSHNKLRIYLN